MRSKTSRVLTPSALFRMLQQRESSTHEIDSFPKRPSWTVVEYNLRHFGTIWSCGKLPCGSNFNFSICQAVEIQRLREPLWGCCAALTVGNGPTACSLSDGRRAWVRLGRSRGGVRAPDFIFHSGRCCRAAASRDARSGRRGSAGANDHEKAAPPCLETDGSLNPKPGARSVPPVVVFPRDCDGRWRK